MVFKAQDNQLNDFYVSQIRICDWRHNRMLAPSMSIKRQGSESYRR